jgi:hypothetical protein
MKTLAQTFEADGYLIIDELVTEPDIVELEKQLASVSLDGVGTRNVLNADWCRQLSARVKLVPAIQEILPPDPVAIQCTYFQKTESENWLVALHRDLSIPIKVRIDSPDWKAWSEKEGVLFARPPETVLKSMVAVRLHLEENNESNSPLQVVRGSHVAAGNPANRINCIVPRGGVLAMRPLLLHASSKLKQGKRRVLHFVFGPRMLPNDAEWAYAV